MEYARIIKKSPATISKQLKKLESKGVLTSEERFNHLLFKGNTASNEFKRAKLSYNMKKIEDSGLIEHLESEFNNPEAITLFGSFSKAEDTPASDIDLLIISPVKKEVNLDKFEKKLKHKIQLFIHSKKEIKKMKDTNKELLNKWINGLTLRGFLEVFE